MVGVQFGHLELYWYSNLPRLPSQFPELKKMIFHYKTVNQLLQPADSEIKKMDMLH